MKHFSLCLFMLLLVLLGKHNGARLRPDSALALAQHPNPPVAAVQSRATDGFGPPLAGLVGLAAQ